MTSLCLQGTAIPTTRKYKPFAMFTELYEADAQFLRSRNSNAPSDELTLSAFKHLIICILSIKEFVCNISR